MNETIKINESNYKLLARGDIFKCKCNEECKESNCLW